MTEADQAKQDYSFGQVAIRENFCTFEHVKECLDIQVKLRGLGIEPKKLGEILIEKGYLTPEQAVQIAKAQVQQIAGPSSKLAIPGYEIVSKIGQGAMGSVYKAKQISMDRTVAIKVLAGRYSKDRGFVDRFVREARAVAKLNHENIISGIDVGEINGLHYFVMEFVDGVPVSTILKREGRIDEKRCLQIAQQMVRALSHAHRHGIVHRDVKPENIMITAAGIAKLCDLGLAKQTKGDAGVTMDGLSVGTPNYISPEQARGEENIDIRTDIYSLGASLYHMATGSTPFSGPNPMVVMTKHVTEYADPPRKRLPALSEGFNDLVMRMMQKRREDRHQDPDQLMADIDSILRGGPVAVSAPGRAPTSAPRAAAAAVGEHKTPTTVHHHSFRTRVGSSSKIGVLVGVGIAAAVLVVVLAVAGGSSSDSGRIQPRPPAPAPPVGLLPPVPVEPKGRLTADIQAFRSVAEKQLASTASDRFTSVVVQVQKKIDEAKRLADFAAQTAWQEELDDFVRRVEAKATAAWAPLKQRAEEHYGSRRFARAAEELSKLEDVYKWLRNDEVKLRTQAGREHEERLALVLRGMEEEYLSGKQTAEQLFKDPARRDEAYGHLDLLAESVLADQRAEKIEKTRTDFIRREIGEILAGGVTPDRLQRAMGRLGALKKIHPGNVAAHAVLDAETGVLKAQLAKVTGDAAAFAAAAAQELQPRLEAALRNRDLLEARRLLYGLYFDKSNQHLQGFFLPASTDTKTLRDFLDPARAAPGNARAVIAAAEQGYKVALGPGQPVFAKELYLDLKIVALLDELLDMALEGAKAQSREKQFKGFSPPLAGAAAADPVPRRPGEAHALQLSAQGGAKLTVPLSPRAAGSIADADLVSLARKVASNDPHFALRAFYLHILAGKPGEAKDWYLQVATDSRAPLERYAEQLKTVVSTAEEQTAEKLYREAWELLFRRKDEPGARARFRECVAKFSHTEYMKNPERNTARNGKSRIQEVEEFFPEAGSKPKGAAPAGRPGLAQVFATTEVRELGRNRYEVGYSFRDDRETGMFSVGDGFVNAARQPAGGVLLQGNGLWYWNVPLRGNVTLDVALRHQGDGSFGLAVCGNGNRAGYLGVVDLNLGSPIDAILRMPLGEGANVLTSVLVQGQQLSVVRNAPAQAQFAREGTKLRFTVNAKTLEVDNPQFTEGRVGVGLVASQALVDRIKITGDVDPGWLDAELRRAEGK
jgi:serine/threonine-protein kinase